MASAPSFAEKISRFEYQASLTEASLNPSRIGHPSRTRANRNHGVRRKAEESGQACVEVTTPPAKRRKTASGYAPPSKYAHLPALKDVLEPSLICVFVGTNPGIRTARDGHAYAHPSNLFWKLLYSSGCTDRLCRPEEDGDLPRLYSMGNTNIVERPTKDAAELSKSEMAAGTPVLETKFRKFRPQAVCIVGKGIWESIWRWRHGRAPKPSEFKYGWQDESANMGRVSASEAGEGEEPWAGARVFVATSTSGLSASTRPHEKEAIWRPFGKWVKERRLERILSAKAASPSAKTVSPKAEE